MAKYRAGSLPALQGFATSSAPERVKYSDDGASSKAICAICCRHAHVSLSVHEDSSFVIVLFSDVKHTPYTNSLRYSYL